MTTASTLFDAYLDMNVLLLFVCLLWLLVRGLMRIAGQGHAVTSQLILLRAAFLAVLLGPAIAALAAQAGRAGMLEPQAVNLTDFILAQYLQGRFEMQPTLLENLLTLRSRLSAGLFGPVGLAVLAAAGACFALLALRLGLAVLRLRRVLAGSHVWRRVGPVDLLVSDTVTVPFSTRGLRRRYVVLPSRLLTQPGDVRIALGHELQHFRQGDVEWEIGISLCQLLFFWNPAFHYWRRQVEQLREMSCDRRVLARRRFDVAAYCDCLLRTCRDGLRAPRLAAVEPPVVALVRPERLFRRGHRALLRRMTTAIDGRAERHPRMVSALVAAPLLGVTLTAAVAIQKPGDWSEDRIMLSTIINLARLQQMNVSAPSFGSLSY